MPPNASEKEAMPLSNEKALRRLEKLFEPGTFVEIGREWQHRCADFGMDKRPIPGDGVAAGYGYVGGEKVFAYAQNEDLLGGSLGEAQAAKICRVLDLAGECGAPVVALNVSSGARIQEGVDALSGYGKIFRSVARLSGQILQISCILGPCAGGAVYSSALTDFVVMARDKGRMFITGPEVVRTVTGENVTADELGGAEAHARKSGCVHFTAKDEDECMDVIRQLLAYHRTRLPNSFAFPRRNRLDAAKWNALLPQDPRQGYDMRCVIRLIADEGAYLEYMPEYAPNLTAGFLRLGGRTVGVVANQPSSMAGCLDIDAPDKAARFIQTCDAHGVALLSCVDVPGFFPGVRQEHGGIIRHGAKMLYAWSKATTPRITLIVRRAYGGAYIAMGSRELGADFVLAWPGAEIAVMGAASAAGILFRKDPPEERRRKTQEYEALFASPNRAAQRGYVDAVIQPPQTRYALLRALDLLSGKRAFTGHGNIPL